MEQLNGGDIHFDSVYIADGLIEAIADVTTREYLVLHTIKPFYFDLLAFCSYSFELFLCPEISHGGFADFVVMVDLSVCG